MKHSTYKTCVLLETTGGDILISPYRSIDATYVVTDVKGMEARILNFDDIHNAYDVYPELSNEIKALFGINDVDPDKRLSESEYAAVTTLKGAFDARISDYFKAKVDDADKRYADFRAGNRNYTREELTFAATLRCACGHGYAYATDCGNSNRQWECSGILTGVGDPNIYHSGPLPFAYSDVKSDCQPSAGGWSTRGNVLPSAESKFIDQAKETFFAALADEKAQFLMAVQDEEERKGIMASVAGDDPVLHARMMAIIRSYKEKAKGVTP